jgi:hypothetical protein
MVPSLLGVVELVRLSHFWGEAWRRNFFVFLVQGFEFRAYTLTWATQGSRTWVLFWYGIANYLPGLAWHLLISTSWVARFTSWATGAHQEIVLESVWIWRTLSWRLPVVHGCPEVHRTVGSPRRPAFAPCPGGDSDTRAIWISCSPTWTLGCGWPICVLSVASDYCEPLCLGHGAWAPSVGGAGFLWKVDHPGWGRKVLSWLLVISWGGERKGLLPHTFVGIK